MIQHGVAAWKNDSPQNPSKKWFCTMSSDGLVFFMDQLRHQLVCAAAVVLRFSALWGFSYLHSTIYL